MRGNTYIKKVGEPTIAFFVEVKQEKLARGWIPRLCLTLRKDVNIESGERLAGRPQQDSPLI